jgi:hypothetical protein
VDGGVYVLPEGAGLAERREHRRAGRLLCVGAFAVLEAALVIQRHLGQHHPERGRPGTGTDTDITGAVAIAKPRGKPGVLDVLQLEVEEVRVSVAAAVLALAARVAVDALPKVGRSRGLLQFTAAVDAFWFGVLSRQHHLLPRWRWQRWRRRWGDGSGSSCYKWCRLTRFCGHRCCCLMSLTGPQLLRPSALRLDLLLGASTSSFFDIRCCSLVLRRRRRRKRPRRRRLGTRLRWLKRRRWRHCRRRYR